MLWQLQNWDWQYSTASNLTAADASPTNNAIYAASRLEDIEIGDLPRFTHGIRYLIDTYIIDGCVLRSGGTVDLECQSV